MTTEVPLRLGLIGAGGFARFVLAAAADLPDVRLVAVTDTYPDRARRLAAGYAADVSPDAAALIAARELAASAGTGSTPRADITAGHAAVRLAAAATAALHDGTTHRLPPSEAS